MQVKPPHNQLFIPRPFKKAKRDNCLQKNDTSDMMWYPLLLLCHWRVLPSIWERELWYNNFCWWAHKLTSPQNRNAIPFISMDKKVVTLEIPSHFLISLVITCIRIYSSGVWHTVMYFFISDFFEQNRPVFCRHDLEVSTFLVPIKEESYTV